MDSHASVRILARLDDPRVLRALPFLLYLQYSRLMQRLILTGVSLSRVAILLALFVFFMELLQFGVSHLFPFFDLLRNMSELLLEKFELVIGQA